MFMYFCVFLSVFGPSLVFPKALPKSHVISEYENLFKKNVPDLRYYGIYQYPGSLQQWFPVAYLSSPFQSQRISQNTQTYLPPWTFPGNLLVAQKPLKYHSQIETLDPILKDVSTPKFITQIKTDSSNEVIINNIPKTQSINVNNTITKEKMQEYTISPDKHDITQQIDANDKTTVGKKTSESETFFFGNFGTTVTKEIKNETKQTETNNFTNSNEADIISIKNPDGMNESDKITITNINSDATKETTALKISELKTKFIDNLDSTVEDLSIMEAENLDTATDNVSNLNETSTFLNENPDEVMESDINTIITENSNAAKKTKVFKEMSESETKNLNNVDTTAKDMHLIKTNNPRTVTGKIINKNSYKIIESEYIINSTNFDTATDFNQKSEISSVTTDSQATETEDSQIAEFYTTGNHYFDTSTEISRFTEAGRFDAENIDLTENNSNAYADITVTETHVTSTDTFRVYKNYTPETKNLDTSETLLPTQIQNLYTSTENNFDDNFYFDTTTEVSQAINDDLNEMKINKHSINNNLSTEDDSAIEENSSEDKNMNLSSTTETSLTTTSDEILYTKTPTTQWPFTYAKEIGHFEQTSNKQPDREDLTKYCKTVRGQFSSPFSCATFINCWDGEAKEQECGPRQLWDERGYCNHPYEVNCGDRPIRLKTCQDDPYGTYINPKNCSEFYVCDADMPNLFQCPEGLHYNENLGVCDYPYKVKCEVNETESNTSTITPSPTNDNKYEKIIKIKTGLIETTIWCKSGSITRYNNNGCNSISLCNPNSFMQKLSCPRGTAFDSRARKCIIESKAIC